MSDRQVVVSSSRQIVPTMKRLHPVADESNFSFEQLEVYQATRAFKIRIYSLVKLLPDEERFRLRVQMRRAGLSLTNAIAEGHGRHTYKDKRHYCHEARGSLQELVDDINDCIDQNYAKLEHLENLRQDAFRVLQLIDGWARWLAKQAAQQTATKPPKKSPPNLKNSPSNLTTRRRNDLTI